MATKIHPTAVIEDGAELGQDVEIGPHTVIGPAVRIGDRTRIGPLVRIDGHTVLGEDNHILGQASLGGAPQDFSYHDEPTRLEMGDRNTIREFVTINRGTVKGGGVTRLCSHVAHDCELADKVILGNNVMLAGHVLVGERANISGAAAAHHFVTVGPLAYVGAMTRMVHDVPPYMILEGHRPRVRGVNHIGLQRAGYSKDVVHELKSAHHELWRSNEPRNQVLERLAAESAAGSMVAELVEFLMRTEIGGKGRYRESLREEFIREGEERILGGSSVR